MLLVSCWLCLAADASADDVADEADLQFNLGTERYERRDYNGALLHYLASNRLANNRNVLFNIALCYESLRQLPEAYRYYTRSLEGEVDAAAIARIRAAQARLAPRVPLLHIVTEPPGAQLFIDRRDLGARGAAPQTMALPAGTYRVFAELDGYERVESEPIELRVGVERTLSLRLRKIVGTIHVPSPVGASVRLDGDHTPELCRTPCDTSAPPGQHTLLLSKAGYRTARVPISVRANEMTPIFVELLAESGSLIVNSDEPGATLELDGVLRGSVPTSLDVSAGRHRLRVSLRGFQTFERELVIQANEVTRLHIELIPSDDVEAVSRLSERTEDAPASVSLISSQELRAMRYPTLAEAVRGTRGIYLTDDRGYTTLGFRGLSVLGGYGKRTLVTLDGMPTNDDWVWASFVGFDLRTDLEDIDRIEIVRGPGSVVYGTSAFTGVINLVTRYRDVPDRIESGFSVASDGVFRARARVTQHFGAQSGIWASVAAGFSEGRDFFFPEYVADGPPEVGGHARGLDGARFGMFTGRAWWDSFSLAWSMNSHDKDLPTGLFGSLLGDGRARQRDTRAFVEARFEPRLSPVTTSLTRVHANLYSYRTDAPLLPEEGGLDTTHFDSYWFGAEQRFVFRLASASSISIGTEAQAFPKAHTREAAEVDGEYLNDRQQLFLAAFYTNLDHRLLSGLKFSAGARLDYYSNSGASLNPRFALIMRPYSGGNLKVLVGKSFIAPSVWESLYSYYDQISNPNLAPENLYSVELELSHRFSPLVVGTVSAYANYVTDLISLQTLPPDVEGTVLTQHQNAETPIGTLGLEAELRREWKQGWMLSGSYSLQRSAYLRSTQLAHLLTFEHSPDYREVPNSPTHLASLRAAAPLLSRSLRVMSRLSFEGGRHDRNASRDGADLQTRTRGALLCDFVFHGSEERLGLEYSLGVYNALDSKAEHPVSGEFRQLSIPISGRSILAAANVSF